MMQQHSVDPMGEAEIWHLDARHLLGVLGLGVERQLHRDRAGAAVPSNHHPRMPYANPVAPLRMRSQCKNSAISVGPQDWRPFAPFAKQWRLAIKTTEAQH